MSWPEQVSIQWDDDDIPFVQDQHADSDFYTANSLKQESTGSTLTHYSDSFCSYSLMLCTLIVGMKQI